MCGPAGISGLGSRRRALARKRRRARLAILLLQAPVGDDHFGAGVRLRILATITCFSEKVAFLSRPCSFLSFLRADDAGV